MREMLVDLIVGEGAFDARETAIAIFADEQDALRVCVGINRASLRPAIEAMSEQDERDALLLELEECMLPEGEPADLVPLGERASAILLELHAMVEEVEIIEDGVDAPGILTCGMVGDERNPPAWCVSYVASDGSVHLHLVFQEDRALELLAEIDGIDEETRRTLAIVVQSYDLPMSSAFEAVHLTGFPAKYFAACVDAVGAATEAEDRVKGRTGTHSSYIN